MVIQAAPRVVVVDQAVLPFILGNSGNCRLLSWGIAATGLTKRSGKERTGLKGKMRMCPAAIWSVSSWHTKVASSLRAEWIHKLFGLGVHCCCCWEGCRPLYGDVLGWGIG
eukprot:2069525-Ditylum_brightwellii.AAC.1